MKLLPFNVTYFADVVDFLKENWAQNHPIYDEVLFNWQYRINDQGESDSQLLVHEDRIIGFLGNIPSVFSIAGEKLSGAGLTMWIIDKKYRNTGLGIRLLMETEKRFPMTYTLGCGQQVVPLYKRMGYTYMDSLNRYVIPLDVTGYQKLLPEAVDLEDIGKWLNHIFPEVDTRELPLDNISLKQMELLYNRTIEKAFIISQFRDESFWNWRYVNSKGYNYHFLGDPETTGAAVVRMDRVYDIDNRLLHGTKVLRLIELLPANGDVWHGKTDQRFIALLRAVLLWAKENGCVAADFQLSNNRLEHILSEVGFKKQNIDYSPNLCGIAGLFQPFRYKVNRINVAWKVKLAEQKTAIVDPNDTYFVKSDCDMDRPNIWPLPEGWNN
ncbi:GNAT family N-acetyltransferase [Brevibacillus humidisoli]|uniref:GNAT family N-acetyltransferase n=1 Tax=Brevibacillus humidisoli TaxID=2895522 RepID=UPI001E33C832|nr:GNAT family N-acetyltransferase [Brevibacillus humidisoli]UFJ40038.1 GNAT family N-acetyltransferase [Brevibacillus humidisoli]